MSRMTKRGPSSWVFDKNPEPLPADRIAQLQNSNMAVLEENRALRIELAKLQDEKQEARESLLNQLRLRSRA